LFEISKKLDPNDIQPQQKHKPHQNTNNNKSHNAAQITRVLNIFPDVHVSTFFLFLLVLVLKGI
jgi:hypothetical protein